MRESIFISHATPEDNAFTRWLGSKLELAGYKVWFDLDRLKGGDYFWDKIESVIRSDSIRFLAVVSNVAVDKDGVKKEWALAETVEKSLPGFVIPIRIDNYDFNLLPIGIHRKNVIDFAKGWHLGLIDLLDTFVEAKIPQVSNPDPTISRHWLPPLKDEAILRKDSKEFLDSSWLSIKSLPLAIESARILGSARNILLTKENCVLPWFEFEDRIVGFAKSTDLKNLMKDSVMLKEAGAIDLKSYIENGSWGEKTVSVPDARRRVVNLIRQAWELAMEAKGLGIYEQSGHRRIFYVTPNLTGGNSKMISFIDADGRKRKKALNGRSEKKQANWAYAVGIVPSLDDPMRLELRATIVFTGDDGLPIESTTRAHKLRRSFCKNWWNQQWRTLLMAFLSLISEGKDEIKLPVGSDRFIVLSSSPIAFESPVGLSDTAPLEDIEPTDSNESAESIDAVESIDDPEDIDDELDDLEESLL